MKTQVSNFSFFSFFYGLLDSPFKLYTLDKQVILLDQGSATCGKTYCASLLMSEQAGTCSSPPALEPTGCRALLFPLSYAPSILSYQQAPFSILMLNIKVPSRNPHCLLHILVIAVVHSQPQKCIFPHITFDYEKPYLTLCSLLATDSRGLNSWYIHLSLR